MPFTTGERSVPSTLQLGYLSAMSLLKVMQQLGWVVLSGLGQCGAFEDAYFAHRPDPVPTRRSESVLNFIRAVQTRLLVPISRICFGSSPIGARSNLSFRVNTQR